MYKIKYLPGYEKEVYKLLKKNPSLRPHVRKTLKLLSVNPHHPSLHSHKVTTHEFEGVWSSRITGDLRILWQYSSFEIRLILIHKIGGHSGKNRVYK
jgi:mRNA-degrading endonuclease YafQ of YafQ-DinJ toxin-antitoxin module